MSVEEESPSRSSFRLENATAEHLMEIAHERKAILDGDTLLKILIMLRNRVEILDDDSPELGDTEVALEMIYSMYIDMTDDTPYPKRLRP